MLAVMKSLCVLNKCAGSGAAALASVGLGLDNQDGRIKTRGRNTRVILLARIPSALPTGLPACLPQSGGGERGREKWGRGRPKQATTMLDRARPLCMQVSSAQFSMHTHQPKPCVPVHQHHLCRFTHRKDSLSLLDPHKNISYNSCGLTR